MESSRRPRRFGGFKRREPPIPMEKKIEEFILKNSRNGYFTKFSTITSKFNITEQKTWEVVGMLLAGGGLESVHDQSSGEMKICEIDKKYHIMSMSRKRKLEDKANGSGQRLNDSGRYSHDRRPRHPWNDGKKRTKREKVQGHKGYDHANKGPAVTVSSN